MVSKCCGTGVIIEQKCCYCGKTTEFDVFRKEDLDRMEYSLNLAVSHWESEYENSVSVSGKENCTNQRDRFKSLLEKIRKL